MCIRINKEKKDKSMTQINIYRDTNSNYLLESDYKNYSLAHAGFDNETARHIKSITTIANPAKKIDEEWRKYQQKRNIAKKQKMVFSIGIN